MRATIVEAYDFGMRIIVSSLVVSLSVFLGGCAAIVLPVEPATHLEYPEMLTLLTLDNTLLTVQAGRPEHVLERHLLSGLRDGDRIVGMDYRPKNNVLYAFGQTAQVYKVDVRTYRFVPLGENPYVRLGAIDVGVNIDPDTDMLRVIGEDGRNSSFSLDTGLLSSENRLVHYTENDIQENNPPALGAIAHTYNRINARMTTAFGIDKRLGMLVRMGSAAGYIPHVSPDTGWLSTIGPLGTGAIGGAHLDISLDTNRAFMATKGDRANLYRVDLKLGKSFPMGTLPGNIVGFAVRPYAAMHQSQ